MKCNVMTITPQIAEEMLKKSNGNRTISRNTVDMLARDIKNDKWALNGEAIVFDENGVLRNGHHRLNAVIKANKPIETLVVEGAPDVWIYDANRVRSARDQMILNGENSIITSYSMQAVIRLHYTMQYGVGKVSANEIKEFYDNNSSRLDTTYYLTISKGTQGGIRKAAYSYAVFCALTCGISETILTDFTKVVSSGTFISAFDAPAMKLRERLLTEDSTSTRNKIVTCIIAENAIADFVARRLRKNKYTAASKPVYSNQKIMRLI